MKRTLFREDFDLCAHPQHQCTLQGKKKKKKCCFYFPRELLIDRSHDWGNGNTTLACSPFTLPAGMGQTEQLDNAISFEKLTYSTVLP